MAINNINYDDLPIILSKDDVGKQIHDVIKHYGIKFHKNECRFDYNQTLRTVKLRCFGLMIVFTPESLIDNLGYRISIIKPNTITYDIANDGDIRLKLIILIWNGTIEKLAPLNTLIKKL